MSVHVRFKLKDPSISELLNEKQNKMFGKVITFFISEKSNQEWLDDINNNEDSHQRHLKPADKDLTMEALKKIFPAYTEAGIGSLDIGFSRTEASDMRKMLNLINHNKSSFSYVDNIHDLVERSESGKEFNHLLYLDTTFPGATSSLPINHPEYKDVFDGSCNCYIMGMNNKEVGVLYGNVEAPKYMRARTTIAPEDSPLIKDKQGRNILLVPLLPLGADSGEFVHNIINHMYGMGVREDQYCLIAKLYPHIKPYTVERITLETAYNIFKHCAPSMNILASGTSFKPEELLAQIHRRYKPQIKHIPTRADKESKGQPAPQLWWFVVAANIIKKLENKSNKSLVDMYRELVYIA